MTGSSRMPVQTIRFVRAPIRSSALRMLFTKRSQMVGISRGKGTSHPSTVAMPQPYTSVVPSELVAEMGVEGTSPVKNNRARRKLGAPSIFSGSDIFWSPDCVAKSCQRTPEVGEAQRLTK